MPFVEFVNQSQELHGELEAVLKIASPGPEQGLKDRANAIKEILEKYTLSVAFKSVAQEIINLSIVRVDPEGRPKLPLPGEMGITQYFELVKEQWRKLVDFYEKSDIVSKNPTDQPENLYEQQHKLIQRLIGWTRGRTSKIIDMTDQRYTLMETANWPGRIMAEVKNASHFEPLRKMEALNVRVTDDRPRIVFHERLPMISSVKEVDDPKKETGEKGTDGGKRQYMAMKKPELIALAREKGFNGILEGPWMKQRKALIDFIMSVKNADDT